MKVSKERMIRRLEALYALGEQQDGTFTRMAFSKEDLAGRELFASWGKAIGMTVRTDEAGNMILRMEGSDKTAGAIAMGSHLDTVPDGGKYDGVVGCVGGLEVCEAYAENKETPKHPIEVIVFADEEGFRFNKGLTGSMAICGEDPEISKDDMDIYGRSRGEIFAECGLDPDKAMQASRKESDIACFIELHVEQGASLDKQKIAIGVVSSIAGVDRYEINVTGEANHAGSTKMCDRKDALVAASKMIGALPAIVKENGNEFTVATVGTIQVKPHSVNVIPGKCLFNLEIRDQDGPVMKVIAEKAKECLAKSCEESGCTFTMEEISHHDPAPMCDWVKKAIVESTENLGYPYLILPSGAFHDSLIMTAKFPTAMIFVPSVGGISHSRYEYTAAEDIQQGAQVLLDTVKKLDGQI